MTPPIADDPLPPAQQRRTGWARIAPAGQGVEPVRLPRPSVSALIAALVAFAALTVNVVAGYGMSAIDLPLSSWMHDQRTASMTTVMIAVSNLGGGIMMTVAALVGCVILVRHGHRWPAALVLIAAIGAAPLTSWSKQLIGRERPPAVDRLVLETNQAFPSGHSLGSFVVIGVLTVVVLSRLHNRQARAAVVAIATLFVIAVGVSRLYLGVHWPTDILGGWLLGGLWLGTCLLGYRTLTDRRTQRAAQALPAQSTRIAA